MFFTLEAIILILLLFVCGFICSLYGHTNKLNRIKKLGIILLALAALLFIFFALFVVII
jgi:hypothetical protein